MYAVVALLVCFVVAVVFTAWFVRRPRPPQPPDIDAAPLPIADEPSRDVAADRFAPRVLLLVSADHAAQLESATALPCIRVTSAAELAGHAARSHAAVAIVDIDLLPMLDGHSQDVPIVALLDTEGPAALRSIVGALEAAPALTSVLVASTLATPEGRKHVAHLLRRLTSDPSHDLLGASSMGRIAKLAQASHRGARFERMTEYFTQHGVSTRTLAAISDVAEELVMNALYNAPGEAGYFAEPVSRTEDVTMPADRACEISYGVDGNDVFVRVRDSFGSLERSRLLDVLARCSTDDVSLDESRGGAGLGLWRIFSRASAVAVTVIPDHLTDIVVRVPAKGGRGRQLMAVHLFFTPRQDDDPFQLDRHSSLVDRSITLLHA
jgi:hypothetical protein